MKNKKKQQKKQKQTNKKQTNKKQKKSTTKRNPKSDGLICGRCAVLRNNSTIVKNSLKPVFPRIFWDNAPLYINLRSKIQVAK